MFTESFLSRQPLSFIMETGQVFFLLLLFVVDWKRFIRMFYAIIYWRFLELILQFRLHNLSLFLKRFQKMYQKERKFNLSLQKFSIKKSFTRAIFIVVQFLFFRHKSLPSSSLSIIVSVRIAQDEEMKFLCFNLTSSLHPFFWSCFSRLSPCFLRPLQLFFHQYLSLAMVLRIQGLLGKKKCL